MSYIIFDLEWNQPCSKECSAYRKYGDRLPLEIIQIGAVRVGPDGAEDTFQRVIRPQYYKKLHFQVKKLISLTEAELKKGCAFPEAVAAFREWCGQDALFFTWGPDDFGVLRRNLAFYGIEDGWLAPIYNLQRIFRCQTAGEDQPRLSLPFVVEYYGIAREWPVHDALGDARYTAEILRRLDIPRGIAEYDLPDPAPAGAPPRGKERAARAKKGLPGQVDSVQKFRGLASRAEGLRNPEIVELTCPRCGVPMQSETGFVRHSSGVYYAVMCCGEHRKYLVQLRFLTEKDGTTSARRTIRRAREGDRERYCVRRGRQGRERTPQKSETQQ